MFFTIFSGPPPTGGNKRLNLFKLPIFNSKGSSFLQVPCDVLFHFYNQPELQLYQN